MNDIPHARPKIGRQIGYSVGQGAGNVTVCDWPEQHHNARSSERSPLDRPSPLNEEDNGQAGGGANPAAPTPTRQEPNCDYCGRPPISARARKNLAQAPTTSSQNRGEIQEEKGRRHGQSQSQVTGKRIRLAECSRRSHESVQQQKVGRTDTENELVNAECGLQYASGQ